MRVFRCACVALSVCAARSRRIIPVLWAARVVYVCGCCCDAVLSGVRCGVAPCVRQSVVWAEVHNSFFVCSLFVVYFSRRFFLQVADKLRDMFVNADSENGCLFDDDEKVGVRPHLIDLT